MALIPSWRDVSYYLIIRSQVLLVMLSEAESKHLDSGGTEIPRPFDRLGLTSKTKHFAFIQFALQILRTAAGLSRRVGRRHDGPFLARGPSEYLLAARCTDRRGRDE